MVTVRHIYLPRLVEACIYHHQYCTVVDRVTKITLTFLTKTQTFFSKWSSLSNFFQTVYSKQSPTISFLCIVKQKKRFGAKNKKTYSHKFIFIIQNSSGLNRTFHHPYESWLVATVLHWGIVKTHQTTHDQTKRWQMSRQKEHIRGKVIQIVSR